MAVVSSAVTPASAQLGKPEGLYYKSWAVIIGIEDYVVAPKLPGAVANGKRMAEALRALGFEEVVEFYNKEASSKQMQHIINDVLPRKLGRNDRLVLYFVGHAGQTTDLHGKPLGYLVPWDAQIAGVSKAVTLDQIKDVGHRVMAKHMLVLLDAPVSGWEVTPSQQLSLEGRTSPEQETDKRALQVLTAGTYGETLTWPEGVSPFVGAVAEGIRGAADRNKNGWLMATELADFVTQAVQKATAGTQHPQFARLDGDGDTILIEGALKDFVADSAGAKVDTQSQQAKAYYDEAFGVLQAQGSPEEAVSLLNKALALQPTYGDAYVLKSYIYFAVKPNLPEALAAAQLAVTHAPQNPDSFYTLGLVQEQQQRYAEAEQAFRKALAVNPEYADVVLSLAELYEDRLNDLGKAAEQYKRYQELGGTDSRASLFFRKHPPPQ
ncbi:MAG: tetratricopeptide repeat protein [Nitrospiraceae bacterium]